MANLLTANKCAAGFWLMALSMKCFAEGPFPKTTTCGWVNWGIDFATGRLFTTILPMDNMV